MVLGVAGILGAGLVGADLAADVFGAAFGAETVEAVVPDADAGEASVSTEAGFAVVGFAGAGVAGFAAAAAGAAGATGASGATGGAGGVTGRGGSCLAT